MRVAEQDRADIAQHRKLWRSWQPFVDPAAFVFIDEVGASTKMVRHYGGGPRGERLINSAPHGH